MALYEQLILRQAANTQSGSTCSTDGSGTSSPTKLSFVTSGSSTIGSPQSSLHFSMSSSSAAPLAAPSASSTAQTSAALGTSAGADSSSSSNDKGLGISEAKLLECDPIEVLHRAWDNTLAEFFDLELVGSTTALIALLKDDELRLANLGDCCCSIIRGDDYIFRSQEQQHSFNYPYAAGTSSRDTPRKDGQRYNIKVQEGDVVILSSDGLVDNLFDEDILEEVERSSVASGSAPPQVLSEALCRRAKAVSEDQRAVTSPFQQRANEEGIHFVGGKPDDISVLVAVISSSSSSSSGSAVSSGTEGEVE